MNSLRQSDNKAHKSVLIVAAEASSSHYAIQIMKYLKKEDPEITFFGIGSKEMEKEGFKCLAYAEDMAIVGLVEVLQNYRELRRIFYSILDEAKEKMPKVVLLLDYPDFNLRLAKKLKEKNHRIFYYISPQVWAWRQDRIHQIKATCEKVFIIFPFEAEFYLRHNVPHEFVGHPLLDDLKDTYYDDKFVQARRQQVGIKNSESVLLLMPGSRRGEIARHFSVQLAAAEILLKKFPHLRLIIACAPTLTKEELVAFVGDFKSPFQIIKDEPFSMISLADYVIVASGTATLQVGLLGKPMVIMYRVNWLTGKIGNFLTRHLRFFGLPNLVLNESVVRELKQEEAVPMEIVKEIEKLITNSQYCASIKSKLLSLKLKLGDAGANLRVSRSIMKVMRD